MMDGHRSSAGLSEPPEGVLAGESVPRENEAEGVRESTVERIMGELKGRGEPYASMSDSELEERARRLAEGNGGDA